MLTSEILSQVRRIEIATGRLVSETFAGEYHSVFKGRGMEFSEVREYLPGDDIRSIDWNVTARLGRPFVKQYVEERELTVMLACDISGSQFFGTRKKMKNEIAAELSALFAFAALKNNDKAGLMLFTSETELYIPPKKGRQHVLRLVRELLAHKPKKKGTSISACLDTVNRVLKRSSILILISDFLDSGFEQAVKRTTAKHDFIPVIIQDPLENSIPKIAAVLSAQDAETGETMEWDISSKNFHADYSKLRLEKKTAVEKLFRSLGVDWITIRTDKPIVDPVVHFFKQREKRFK